MGEEIRKVWIKAGAVMEVNTDFIPRYKKVSDVLHSQTRPAYDQLAGKRGTFHMMVSIEWLGESGAGV